MFWNTIRPVLDGNEQITREQSPNHGHFIFRCKQSMPACWLKQHFRRCWYKEIKLAVNVCFMELTGLFYRHFKTAYRQEEQNQALHVTFAQCLACFCPHTISLYNHRLPIEVGRHQRSAREDRKWMECNLLLEINFLFFPFLSFSLSFSFSFFLSVFFVVVNTQFDPKNLF